MSTYINPARRRGLLAAVRIPYSAYATSGFALEEHLRHVSCTYAKVGDENRRRANPVNVPIATQIEHWLECRESAATGDDSGWTLCIAGQGSTAYPEAVAAELAALYLSRAGRISWVNVTSGRWGERKLSEHSRGVPVDDLHALFVTGIRWDGDSARFDKAFDLLREASQFTDRIVVGVGADPIALARRMDIPVQRVLNVVESKLVHM